MKRLLDIAPAGTITTKVPVGGGELEVMKISAKRVTGLLMRYPELGDLMGGKKVPPMRLVEIAVDASAALIAAGCGYSGEEAEAAEAKAAELDIEDQLRLVEAIAKLTFPPIGPLFDQLKARVAIFLEELEKEEAPADETQPTV
ncbi:hypothetical protein [Mesorhizobium sp.]|uniref:phage pre-tape measure protein n=1 Tax=Mesorhizobium sp. TaxID=1871066 RepID=UPI000FE46A56|nr:hypothetical protein [Mesorhizobium sp.]RWN11757.1 MAG: hypothetical protein EOR87_14655 [Mesorhizobium sp.]RWN19456.1 MAG: hypothetical protein EOR88_09910 [Mesorhizobium sp.]